MSVSRRILISSPSTLISVPAYLPKRTSSPSTTPIGGALAGVEHLAGADGEDLAPLRLLLGGVGQDDPARGLLLGLDLLDHDAVFKRANLGHRDRSFFDAVERRPASPEVRRPGHESFKNDVTDRSEIGDLGKNEPNHRDWKNHIMPPFRPCHPCRPFHPCHRRDHHSGRPGPPFFDFFSTMMASVVRRRPATEAAFWRAERVTLVGSTIPAANMSPQAPVSALKP